MLPDFEPQGGRDVRRRRQRGFKLTISLQRGAEFGRRGGRVKEGGNSDECGILREGMDEELRLDGVGKLTGESEGDNKGVEEV